MSSPLDGRIRTMAREEVASALGDRSSGGAPGVEELQQQITDLHEHLHVAVTAVKRLEGRVEALEKTPAAHPAPEPEQPRPTARRASRKDSSG